MNYTQWYAQNGKFQKHEQWMVDNLILETIGGSQAYGCQNENSDFDITAIVLPKYEYLYPQKYGFILDFDQLPNFKRKELKGDKSKVLIGEQKVEAEWISLVEFFVQAGLKGSPGLVEILFVRNNLVTVGTKSGWYLRDKRRLFLSMKTYHAFRGYANGQIHRIRERNPETDDRKALIDKYGYDIKMSYHTLRLMDQLDQILTTNDIDLMRNKEECKLMRKGEWGNFDRFDLEFQRRMSKLDDLVIKSNLSQFPNQAELKTLLQELLEEHYGSIDNFTQNRFTEYVSAKDVMDKLVNIEKLLDERND